MTEPIYAIQLTPAGAYDVVDTQSAVGRHWLATFRRYGDALDFARAKQASRDLQTTPSTQGEKP